MTPPKGRLHDGKRLHVLRMRLPRWIGAMSKAPSMPVFPDALIGDTTDLSMEEFGAYCMILFVTWRNNGQALADDPVRMARVCRVSERRWTNELRPVLARFFDLTGGTWRQLRLEKEWDFVAKKTACQSDKGKKSAEAKAMKNNKTSSTAVDARLQPEFNPHTHTQLFTSKADALEATIKPGCVVDVKEIAAKKQIDAKAEKQPVQCDEPAPARVGAGMGEEAAHGSSGGECGGIGEPGTTSHAAKPPPRVSDADFDEWWRHAPRKVGRGNAERAYRAALKHATPADLLAGIQRFAGQVRGTDPQYIAHPATWLNGKRWLDEPETQNGGLFERYDTQCNRRPPGGWAAAALGIIEDRD